NKFKKEERINSWRIDKAFRERRKLDIEYFSKLLEKILEFQKERKKLKSLVQKNSKRTSRTKAKGKKSAKNLSDVEEEDADEVHDLEEGQEKENEDQCNEGETPASELKNKHKRKKTVEALTEEPNEKKNKTGEAPEDSEATLPESHTNSEMSEKISNVNAAKERGNKPAKLSRARAPKPLLPLGLKRGRKGKNEETESDKGDKNTSDEAHKEQVNQDESDACKASRGKSAGDDISSEEEEATVKHRGPTRYGRVPKQTAAFGYACKEQSHSSVAETTSASPSSSKSKPKCTVKRGKSLKPQSDKPPKKAKLVTLRSLNSDFSDEDDEEGQDPCCSSSQDMSGFVPAGLHSLNAVISEVDDPMVEDVIDFFTSEQTEVSQDESYNEAAQTLLTMGNVSHVSQSTQGEVTTQGFNSGTAVDGKTSDHFDEKIRDQQGTPASLSTACPQKVRDISETVASMDPQNSEMSSSDSSHVKTSEQMCNTLKIVHEEESGSQLKSKPQSPSNNSPSTKTLCLSKVKPKPNIETAPPTSQTKTSKEQKAEEGHSVVPIEVTSAVNEAAPNRTESDEALLEDGDSLTEVLLKEEKSVSSLITQGCSVSLSQIESSRNETARDTDSSDYKDVSVIPHDGPGETDLSSSLKSKSELTQVVQEPHTLSDSFQGGNSQHPPPENDLPVSQRNMGAVAARRSRLSKVKPNLPQMSRVALNKSQISKETVKKDPLTTSNSESQEQTIKDVQTPSTTFNLIEDPPAGEVIKIHVEEAPKVQSNTEPQAEQASNAELAAAPGESSSPATLITPADKLASKVSSASQLRRSHLQKVKPKPNLTQAPRAMKTKSQSTENTAMKSPGPNPESLTNSTAEVLLQAVCSSTSDQQIAATGCTLSLNPVLDSESIHVSTEKQSTNEENKIPTERVNQVEMEAASDQSALGYQNLTEVPVEQSKKQTTSDSGSVSKFSDKDSVSQNEMSESRSNYTMTSHVSPTCFDSDPVQDQRSQPAVFVRAEEESAVRKHDCEITAAGQPRRNRLSQIKPRPNIPQTSRATKFKPQTLENQSEKQTNPEQTVSELEPKTCGLSSEKQSENTNPASGLTPPLTSGSHGRPSNMKTTHTDDQTSELSEEQSTKEQESTSNEFPVASSLSISNNQALTGPTDNEPQFGQGSNLNSGTDLERSDHPAACKTASEELQVGQKEDKSACHFKRSRSLKPTPNLSQTSRLARSKGNSKSQVPPKLCVQQTIIEKEKYTEFTDENLTPEVRASQSMNVAPTADSASTGSQEGTVSNICASVQDHTKPHAATLLVSEQKDEKFKTENSTAMQFVKKTQSPASEEKRKTEEKANVGQLSSSVLTEKIMPERRQRFPKVKPKPNVESSCRVTVKKLQSDDHSKPLEDHIKDMSSTVMLEQQLESTKDTMSNNDPDSPLSGNCTLEMPVTVYSSNAQTVAAQTAITDVPSTSNASPSSDERDVSVQGSDPTPSELIDSSKNSGKAPQARRGRLIKPKPNLRCSSRLQQTQAVKNTKPAEADSGNASQALSASGDLKLVSELGACTQEPEKDLSSNDAHSSHYCVKQGSSNEHKTSSAEGIQRDLLLSELLPEQVPSDPDEPFFILSLTEVPVSSTGEVETCPAESLSYLPASGQQSSVSEVSLEAEDHPELSVEPKVFNTTIAEPNKTTNDDYAEKKTRLSSKNKVSASDFSEANIVKTRDPLSKKTASKRNKKKPPSGATQMSSSEPKVSSSNYIIPTQTKSATEAVTPSASLPVGLSSASTVLTSPEGESGFADEEPTSVSRYFLTDIFTEVED
ncbi:hypothetical protein CRENBAI_011700, partial [Crenichthys baileyi]